MYSEDHAEIEEEQFAEDAIEVHDYIVAMLGLNPTKQVIILGRSLGSGPAVLLASQRNCAALVLFAPFKSLRSVVAEQSMFAIGAIAPNMFNNDDRMGDIRCSTFIIHGTKDETVPLAHSQVLFQRSGALPLSKKLHIVEGMTHKEFELVHDFLIPATQFLMKQAVVSDKAYGPPINVLTIKEHGTPPDKAKKRAPDYHYY